MEKRNWLSNCRTQGIGNEDWGELEEIEGSGGSRRCFGALGRWIELAGPGVLVVACLELAGSLVGWLVGRPSIVSLPPSRHRQCFSRLCHERVS
mmetsp:Transcript_1281/g.3160  ORF Transcript_1281/g.3160 Transcript_1281/m.3160 type:complete len:94 (+) Transcript_1281:3418-3699(+)